MIISMSKIILCSEEQIEYLIYPFKDSVNLLINLYHQKDNKPENNDLINIFRELFSHQKNMEDQEVSLRIEEGWLRFIPNLFN